MIKTALLSVSDKNGVVAFAKGLHQLGVQIISTGGTAQLLAQHQIPVTEVATLTHFPEMLDGRVKTLHPAVHAGLLARRTVPAHMSALAEQGIQGIDLLAVNLYPFEATIAQKDCSLTEAIENIDIGGPAMVRSAAKNWESVAVLTDAAQYGAVLDELKRSAQISSTTRLELAIAAFNRISQYDAAISNYLSALNTRDPAAGRLRYGAQVNESWVKVQDLRYGENPHQSAAFYRDLEPGAGSIATAVQLQGKALSFNNIADADTAWECVKSFDDCACVIVKHANPCGVALGDGPQAAYSKALETDRTSAFGGIVAFNRQLDAGTVQVLLELFVEVLIAPAFEADALTLLEQKKSVRVLKIDWAPQAPTPSAALVATSKESRQYDFKRVGSGLLIQSADRHRLQRADLRVVTTQQPTQQQLSDLLFAWSVAKYVKSNAIVYCKDGKTLGIGAGQMSRIDSARMASWKAKDADLTLAGAAVASDAFFPFRDGLDVVVDAGASCIIQPGGSVRDQEVIDAANERGVVMVFTGMRHFRH